MQTVAVLSLLCNSQQKEKTALPLSPKNPPQCKHCVFHSSYRLFSQDVTIATFPMTSIYNINDFLHYNPTCLFGARVVVFFFNLIIFFIAHCSVLFLFVSLESKLLPKTGTGPPPPDLTRTCPCPPSTVLKESKKEEVNIFSLP